MKYSLRTLITAVFLMLAVVGLASAQEFRFLWSDHHQEVLDKSNATIYTPVSKPANAVDWQYSVGEAQQAVSRAYPRERVIVQRVHVVRDQAVAESATFESMNINGKQVLIHQW